MEMYYLLSKIDPSLFEGVSHGLFICELNVFPENAFCAKCVRGNASFETNFSCCDTGTEMLFHSLRRILLGKLKLLTYLARIAKRGGNSCHGGGY